MPIMVTVNFWKKPLLEGYNKIQTKNKLSSTDFEKLKKNELSNLKKWLCLNTKFLYKESFTNIDIGSTPKTTFTDFEASCNLLKWADDRIRLTFLLAHGPDVLKITGKTSEIHKNTEFKTFTGV